MRLATDDESKGIEVVNQFLDSMRIDLQKSRGQERYLDLTREGVPELPGDVPMDSHSDGNDDDPADDEDRAMTRTPGSHLTRLEDADLTPRAPDFSLHNLGGSCCVV